MKIDKIEIRERELHIKPDEVLVKTHLTGICGSDKNLYHGVIPPQGGLNTEMRKPFSYPYYLGHEGGGTVEAVGDMVRNFKPGDRVMAFGWIETFSEYFLGREDDLEKVPEGMDMDPACLGEPIACAVFSGMQSRIQLGDVMDEKLKLAMGLGLDYTVNAEKENPIKAVLEISNGRGADVVVEMAGTESSINMCTEAVR